jgi:hypothetical protein
MFGRDAADERMRLTPLLRRFDVRWSKAGSAQLFADLERTANELADAADAKPFHALEGGPLGKFMTVTPARRLPDGQRPAHKRGRRRRARPRLPRPRRAGRVNRADGPGCQPLEDHCGAGGTGIDRVLSE